MLGCWFWPFMSLFFNQLLSDTVSFLFWNDLKNRNPQHSNCKSIIFLLEAICSFAFAFFNAKASLPLGKDLKYSAKECWFTDKGELVAVLLHMLFTFYAMYPRAIWRSCPWICQTEAQMAKKIGSLHSWLWLLSHLASLKSMTDQNLPAPVTQAKRGFKL